MSVYVCACVGVGVCKRESERERAGCEPLQRRLEQDRLFEMQTLS